MNMQARPPQLDERTDITTATPPINETATLWRDLPARGFNAERLSRNRVVTVAGPNPEQTSFDMLRTSLVQTLRQNGWKSVAITSPTAGCGKTVLAVNLAFSLVRNKECRTLLVDIDLRRPHVAKTLGMEAPPSIERFLSGRCTRQEALTRYGGNLAVLANGEPVPQASELLQASTTMEVLSRLQKELCPDVVIFDMPPMLAADDVLAFAPNVDSTLLVVAAESTRVSEADVCEQELSQRTNLLGVVLNKCRYTPGRYDY